MSNARKLSLLVVVVFAVFYATRGSSRLGESATAKPVSQQNLRTAVFAGGCFWCMEPPFEKLAGVIAAESGYTGGFKADPTYEEVSHSDTGHVEAVRVTYDVSQISYDDLLEVFWRNINPTDSVGQFVDRGDSYLSAIFVANDEQRVSAERSKQALEESDRFDQPIVTPIRDAATFYLAEDYHQDYYKKNPLKYKYYRYRSGRDQFIDEAWGEARDFVPAPIEMGLAMDGSGTQSRDFIRPNDEQIRARLTPLQYNVTQHDATERAFQNEWWNNSREGVYVDIVSGEPLFSSRDKYKSGTGWPSFTRPLFAENVVETTDYKLIWPRTEVRSKHADSHLGHVFDDGPEPTGRRYCINSAALRFLPAEELEDEGYADLLSLFNGSSSLDVDAAAGDEMPDAGEANADEADQTNSPLL